MAVGGLWKRAQRALFAKPTPERQLLKIVKQNTLRRVVELGVDSIESTQKMLVTAVAQAAGEPVRYTGFDAFDERHADKAPLPLVAAYRQLAATGAEVRLAPGGPTAATASQANALQDTDLVLIARATTDDELAPLWFYLPRMCHPGTLVMRLLPASAVDEPDVWSPVPLDEIAARAGAPVRYRAA